MLVTGAVRGLSRWIAKADGPCATTHARLQAIPRLPGVDAKGGGAADGVVAAVGDLGRAVAAEEGLEVHANNLAGMYAVG
jgi:hypothetical protein